MLLHDGVGYNGVGYNGVGYNGVGYNALCRTMRLPGLSVYLPSVSASTRGYGKRLGFFIVTFYNPSPAPIETRGKETCLSLLPSPRQAPGYKAETRPDHLGPSVPSRIIMTTKLSP